MKHFIIPKEKDYITQGFKNISKSFLKDGDLIGVSSIDSTRLELLLYGHRVFTQQEFELAVAKIEAGEAVNIYAKDYVRASVVGEAEGRRFRGTSILEETITEAGTQSFTYTLPANREIDGVRFKAYGATWKDRISMEVCLPDGTVLDKFVDGWHLDEPTMLKLYRAKLNEGLEIKITIETYSEDLRVWCDAFLHEYPKSRKRGRII